MNFVRVQNEQIEDMMKKKANVVISTPGRYYSQCTFIRSVLDLMNLQLPRVAPAQEDAGDAGDAGDADEGKMEIEEEEGKQYLSLDSINYIVIDEADRMLDISLLYPNTITLSFTSPWFQRAAESHV